MSLRRWLEHVVAVSVAAGLGGAAVVTLLRSFHGRTPWLEPLGFITILAITLLVNQLHRAS